MSDWYETRLGDIADICIGGTPSRAEASYWASTGEEGFPWVSISDLKSRIVSNTAESITALGARNSNVKLVPCGTIMMSFKLSLGRIAFAGRDIYTNEAIASFEVDTDKIDKTFLFYQLPEVVKLAITDTAIKGATLNKAKLNELVIPHPELVVQRKIAEILSTIDNQIDATQALIDKYTAIKQGMMADLFSRGIDPETKALRPTFEEAPELYHETTLGMLPKGWNVSDLGSISLRVTDGSHQAIYTVENGDIPFLFVSCVRGGKILWDKCSYISKEDYHLISKGREPRKGDILYTAVGSYGHAALVSKDSEFSFQRHIAYIKPNNQFIDSGFLCEFLNSEQTKSWADRVALGNAQKTVTLGELSKFPVVVPEKIEQEKIVGSLQAVNEALESEYVDLSKLQQTKRGLMQDLLTGKVHVSV
ncbi:type I restriction enzyme, S subunit [Pseudoalteromonas sp. DSM 26666]|uniref:restriction endonuclease subunit S n=1 Tax=Pseudoalteromonas sp. DSM 26666 TaxID=1761892 RepID=UPI0008DFE833|nr:restriction endonuclease subunit S [Pseudoalteromonas sp. DSM 26666]SFT69355.1 type I restriction enzyme, S subunit [Pseudoalteromonas sp. DSM 26666]